MNYKIQMNSLNFHFHFYEKNEKWILKDGLLKSFSIFSKNENELKFSFFVFKFSEKWIGTRVPAFESHRKFDDYSILVREKLIKLIRNRLLTVI